MKNKCDTCGEEQECGICHGAMNHVHFTTGEPPAWWHVKRTAPILDTRADLS